MWIEILFKCKVSTENLSVHFLVLATQWVWPAWYLPLHGRSQLGTCHFMGMRAHRYHLTATKPAGEATYTVHVHDQLHNQQHAACSYEDQTSALYDQFMVVGEREINPQHLATTKLVNAPRS